MRAARSVGGVPDGGILLRHLIGRQKTHQTRFRCDALEPWR